MSSINVPVQDVGFHLDPVHPVPHRPPSGSSVAAFSMLMGAPIGVLPETEALPARQTTGSQELTEMLEFTRLNMERQFVYPTGAPQEAVTTPSAPSLSGRGMNSAGSTHEAPTQSSVPSETPSANAMAQHKGQHVASAAMPEKKAAPVTFFQSLRRQFKGA